MRGYKEKGSINTPLELAVRNQIDRFSLAMDARFLETATGVRETSLNQQAACLSYALEFGIDQKESPIGNAPIE